MIGKRRRRPRRSSAQWEALVKEWQEGAETTADFCARHDINESTLYRWRARLESDGRTATQSAGFLPVRVVDPPDASPVGVPDVLPPSADSPRENSSPPTTGGEGHVEIVVNSGRIVRVWGDVAEAALSRVLTVVEQC